MSSEVWQSQKPKGRRNCPGLKVTKETTTTRKVAFCSFLDRKGTLASEGVVVVGPKSENPQKTSAPAHSGGRRATPLLGSLYSQNSGPGIQATPKFESWLSLGQGCYMITCLNPFKAWISSPAYSHGCWKTYIKQFSQDPTQYSVCKQLPTMQGC